MQISVASSSLLAIPVIEAIIASEHSLASIISTPDKKSGRGQILTPTALAQWGEERNLMVAKPVDTPSLNQHLLAVQPQLIITISYGRLIPVEVLHGPRFGWLNIHFSLLPRWRGAAPVQWALLEGDPVTGISIFKLDKGMDTGPLYYQEEVEIGHRETTEDLLTKMSVLAGSRIMEVVSQIRSGVKPKPQSNSGVTLAPKITKEMGQIPWGSDALAIIRKFRALEERPGVWSTFRDQRIALHGVSEHEDVQALTQPGEIAIIKDKLLVRCLDAVLEIQEVTWAGKKRMSGVNFARGARIESGERFL